MSSSPPCLHQGTFLPGESNTKTHCSQRRWEESWVAGLGRVGQLLSEVHHRLATCGAWSTLSGLVHLSRGLDGALLQGNDVSPAWLSLTLQRKPPQSFLSHL